MFVLFADGIGVANRPYSNAVFRLPAANIGEATAAITPTNLLRQVAKVFVSIIVSLLEFSRMNEI